MITSRQPFPGDAETTGLKADNGVITSGTTAPLPPDKGTPKANVTPPKDEAGKPNTTPGKPTGKQISGTVTPIRTNEPQQPRKECNRTAAGRKYESQGRTDIGNFHKAGASGFAHKHESRTKHLHSPAKKGNTDQSARSLNTDSRQLHRSHNDVSGYQGKQKTPADRRRSCKPQPTHDRNPQGRNESPSGKSRESQQGQERTDTAASRTGTMTRPAVRTCQGWKKSKDYKDHGMNSYGKHSPAGTRKNGSLPTHRHADDTAGTTTCKTPADRRRKHVPQQTTGFNTPRTPRGENNKSAGGNPKSKVVLIETGQRKAPGDLPRHAGSQHRNMPRGKVYDPNLGRHPIPVCNCTDLMERIVDDTNFLTALKKVNRKPKKAAGIDHRTVREVCGPLLASKPKRDKIRKLLLNGTYNPCTVRTTSIPKKGGKRRTLGIAIVLDRIVQTMITQVISGILPKSTWSKFSFAYQEKRDVTNAIAEVNRIREEEYAFCVCLDLKTFFDLVPHDRLVEKLKVHLLDQRVVELVKKFLTPVMADPDGSLRRNRIGTPQGSVLSPWLASKLYMHELDMELKLRGNRYVRYADDVTIFCRSRSAAKRVKTRVIQFVEDIMKCPANRKKTTIVDIRKLAVLGVYMDKGHWHIQREKEQEACGSFLRALEMYSKSKDKAVLEKAVARMNGFLQHYRRIPGLARKDVRDIARWSTKKWRKLLGSPFENDPETVSLYLRLVIQV